MISHRKSSSTTVGTPDLAEETQPMLSTASGPKPKLITVLNSEDTSSSKSSMSANPNNNTNRGEDKVHSSTSSSFCNAQVLFACSLFMTVGPLLIMTNKAIITELEFKYPVIVTSFGIISSSIIVHFFHRLGYIEIRAQIKKLVTWQFLMSHIFVISFLQSLTMYFGNKAYIFLSVSLIQMLKAFTPVMTMFLLFLSGQQKMTYPLIGSILLLSFGTAITSTGVTKADANLAGFLLAAGAQCTEALKLTLQQKLLQGFKVRLIANKNSVNVNDKSVTVLRSVGKNGEQVEYEQKIKFSIFEGLYYYAPMTFLSICIIVVPLELSDFIANYDTNVEIIRNYVWLFLAAGLLGFFVNVAAFMVTKVTSGLYLKALNAFRNVCLVIACVIIFGDVVTAQQALGYVITLVGFAYYNYVKLKGL